MPSGEKTINALIAPVEYLHYFITKIASQNVYKCVYRNGKCMNMPPIGLASAAWLWQDDWLFLAHCFWLLANLLHIECYVWNVFKSDKFQFWSFDWKVAIPTSRINQMVYYYRAQKAELRIRILCLTFINNKDASKVKINLANFIGKRPIQLLSKTLISIHWKSKVTVPIALCCKCGFNWIGCDWIRMTEDWLELVRNNFPQLLLIYKIKKCWSVETL